MTVRALREDETVLPTTGVQRTKVVRKLRAGESVTPAGMNPIAAFGRGANVAIAKTLGAPVDILESVVGPAAKAVSEFAGLSPKPTAGGFGSSEAIQRGFSNLGIAPPPGTEDPASVAKSAGEFVGATALTLPALLAGPAAAVGSRVAPEVGSLVGRALRSIAETAVRRPGRFLAAETGAAATAGASGEIAAEKFPDSPGARAIGEILGGLAAGIGPSAAIATARGAARLATKAVEKSPFTGPVIRGIRNTYGGLVGRGPERRAQARLMELTGEKPEEVVSALDREKTLKVGGKPVLTHAMRTGRPEIMALERAVVSSSTELTRAHSAKIDRIVNAIKSSLRGIAGAATPEQARVYFNTLIDARLTTAALKADEALAKLGPKATPEQASTLARTEIQNAYRAARAQETELYKKVPGDLSIPTGSLYKAYTEILSTTPRAQLEDIPPLARQFLGQSKREIADAERLKSLGLSDQEIVRSTEVLGTPSDRFGPTESIGEMTGLRSKLLEDQRKSAAAGDLNRARIDGLLANAILEDLDSVAGSEPLAVARVFSRDLNERFTRGEVGKLLGSASAGGPSVKPGLTLETTIGRGGARGREATDAILAAVEKSGDKPALQEIIKDFLRNEFVKRAVREGRVNPRLAASYLRNRQEVLNRFPDLMDEMQAAARAGAEFKVAASDPMIATAGVFLKAEPDKEIARVLRHSDPAGQMKNLIALAETDPTGQAVAGVKKALVEYLLDKSREMVGGREIVSGARLLALLTRRATEGAIKVALSEDELRRLRVIATTARRLEQSLTAEALPKNKIIADFPNLIGQTIAGVIGAKVGRSLNTGTVQAPGFVASLFRRFLPTSDRAERLLIDAIEDEDLFRAMFTPILDIRQAKFVRRQLRAWAIAAGFETSETEQ